MAIEFIAPVVSVGSLAWAVYTVKSTARRERRSFVRNETIKSVSAALEILTRAEGHNHTAMRDGKPFYPDWNYVESLRAELTAALTGFVLTSDLGSRVSAKIDASLQEVASQVARDVHGSTRDLVLDVLQVIREDLTAEAKLLVENPRRGERSLGR